MVTASKQRVKKLTNYKILKRNSLWSPVIVPHRVLDRFEPGFVTKNSSVRHRVAKEAAVPAELVTPWRISVWSIELVLGPVITKVVKSNRSWEQKKTHSAGSLWSKTNVCFLLMPCAIAKHFTTGFEAFNSTRSDVKERRIESFSWVGPILNAKILLNRVKILPNMVFGYLFYILSNFFYIWVKHF